MYEAQAKAHSTPWDTITLSLPPDTPLPVPAARWQRQDGRFLATYTPAELSLAVALSLEQELADLEARLEYYLGALAAATGCDDAQAERLLARCDALNASYTATVTALAAVSRSVHSENPALNDPQERERKHTA